MQRFVMRRVMAGCLAALVGVASVRAAPPEEIERSIQKAIDHLYAEQNNGNWEEVPAAKPDGLHDGIEGGQWGGQTAIVTYALLSAGQNPTREPKLQEAIDFLKKAPMRGTYAVSMRAQVWPLLPAGKAKAEALRDSRLLLSGAKTKGDTRGMWFYYLDNPSDERTDHSASQFAVLGMWACAEAGVEVPPQFWQVQDSLWRQHQMGEGAWPYVYQDPAAWGQPVLSMTAAGLATLFITQDKLIDPKADCKGGISDPVLKRGIDWVSKNFPSDFANPGPNAFVGGPGRRNLYLLYGLSRLGIASGYRSFGGHDWFTEASDYLVKSQAENGSWGNPWETSLGLLVLSRSRAPVAINKLQYPSTSKKGEAWNERPRDVANVTHWVEKQIERKLNWQIVDVDSDPNGWLDAPIVYMSGSEEFTLNKEQIDRLRQYVEAGGLIIGNANCGGAKFTKSFRQLAGTLFPTREFRDLPADHPIFKRQQFKADTWRVKMRLQSVGNGARELMILLPDADPARAWQTQQQRTRKEPFELVANLYQYAAGASESRYRGQTAYVKRDDKVQDNRTVKVARLSYDGQWDPEPGAWRRLANVLHNEQRTEVTVEEVRLGTGKLNGGYQLAHLIGAEARPFTEAERNELRVFITAGGTVLIEAANGNVAFEEAMNRELASLVENAKPTPIAADSPLLAKPYELTMFGPRPYSVELLGATGLRKPMVLDRHGRPAVIFSAMDLSTSMLGTSVDGILGYDAKTATQFVGNLLVSLSKAK